MIIRTFSSVSLLTVTAVATLFLLVRGVDGRRQKIKNHRRSEKPNIVLLMTDDQDTELGSMNYMPKTLRILQGGGAHFENAFVTTPMCCPSRSSMLTGLYVHNHNVYTNNDNCSSIYWRQEFESRSWATYLSNAGYRTGYFGKYLNEYNGDYIPPGWSEWSGLIRNSRFYNYSLNFNGQKMKHGDNYYKDYLTDLIANDSVTFVKQSKQYFPNRPVAIVLSMPAPHGPEDSAPQYQHLFPNVTTHRTPSYNYAPNPDKQWILQYTGQMEPIHEKFTDLLQRKRLQTLQSVDDAVEKIYTEMKHLGELDNTYFIFTSDHGYHLGQYGLAKGKAMPYEFDIRVPFYIRGPKIPKGIVVPNIALNVDIAPTLLDIAGVTVPDHMDGRSIMKLFEKVEEPNSVVDGSLKKRKAWRDSFLVERGKITHKKLVNRERLEAMQNNLITTKEQRLEDECLKAEYQPPCSPRQQWVCERDEEDRLRMVKCRQSEIDLVTAAPSSRRECHCPPTVSSPRRVHRRTNALIHEPLMSEREYRRAQRKLSRRHAVNLHHRMKRGILQNRMIGPPVFNGPSATKRSRRWMLDSDMQNDVTAPSTSCRVLPNNTVVCDTPDVDHGQDLWKIQKRQLDDIIHNYKSQLDRLKTIRRQLKKQRPDDIALPAINLGTTPGEHPGLEAELETELEVGLSERQELDDGSTEEEELGAGHDNFEDGDFATAEAIIPENYQYFGSENLSSERAELSDEERALLSHEDVYNSAEVDDIECNCEPPQNDEFLSERDVLRNERAERKQQKLEDRQRKRDERHEDRFTKNTKKKNKKKNKKLDVSKDCGNNNMKCFTHDNDHWKTAPLWDSTGRNKSSRKHECNQIGLECAQMDNDHWRTEPKWHLGPFCFCPNSNNNTYWCVRTINDTHNYLYCEFITGFISYYNILEDPYQLRNAVHDLDYGRLQQMHEILERLKSCKGSRACTIRTRPVPDGYDHDDDLQNSNQHNNLDLELGSGDFHGSGDELDGLLDQSGAGSGDNDLQWRDELKENVLLEEDITSGDCDDKQQRLKDEFLLLTSVLRLDDV